MRPEVNVNAYWQCKNRKKFYSCDAMWCNNNGCVHSGRALTTVHTGCVLKITVDVSSKLLTVCASSHATAHSWCILTDGHSLCILTTINRRYISTTIYKKHVLSTVYRRWVLHNQYVILYCIVCIFYCRWGCTSKKTTWYNYIRYTPSGTGLHIFLISYCLFSYLSGTHISFKSFRWVHVCCC